MSLQEKFTSIADKIRSLLGISGIMGLDAMATNLQTAVNSADSQTDLIAQIKTALEDKSAASVSIVTKTTTPSSNSTTIVFSGLTAEPKMFCVIPTANVSLSSQSRYVTGVVYDGDTIRGLYSNNSTATHSNSYFSQTYSNGTLTVKTSSSTNGGNFRSGIAYMLVCIV